MIFVTLSLILKNFSLGGACWLTVDHLNLKYIRRSGMAEWLTHPTKDAGGTRFEFLRIPVINFRPLDVNVCLGVFFCLLQSKV